MKKLLLLSIFSLVSAAPVMAWDNQSHQPMPRPERVVTHNIECGDVVGPAIPGIRVGVLCETQGFRRNQRILNCKLLATANNIPAEEQLINTSRTDYIPVTFVTETGDARVDVGTDDGERLSAHVVWPSTGAYTDCGER